MPPVGPDRDRPFEVFISYSHKSEAVKDRLRTNLAVLERLGLVATWTDRAIPPGARWRDEIASAIARADAAVFVVCEHFLASAFCMDQELPEFLRRQREDGCLILFVLADHCYWQAALLAELPGATPRLYGREADLQRIEVRFAAGAPARPGGVLLWVAPGGVGKSALTRWWIEHHHWPAGTRCIGHSFYSQGSQNQTVSARAFLLRALAALGDAPEPTTSDHDLGRRLAERAAAAPTLLVLDGLEPLQQASTDPGLNGRLKDQGLAALLEGLGRAPGQALCLASSRLPIPDALIESQPAFHQVPLGVLPRAGSVELLGARGLEGTPEQLDALAARCADHPLALVLAAELTHSFLGNQAAAFLARDWPVLPAGGPERHAATLMGWLDAALRDEQAALDRALVRVLGLFDRPAPWGAIQVLKEQEPPIAGLTEALHGASEAELEEGLARLRQWGLADREGAGVAGRMPALLAIDAHPLVREHFGQALEAESPAAWRAAHGVLFDWFRAQPAEHQPATLEDLEPLYRAVGHGCRAGRYDAAKREVYQDRILRGGQGYTLFQLGAISADLAALAGFFPAGWSRPPVTGDLSEPDPDGPGRIRLHPTPAGAGPDPGRAARGAGAGAGVAVDSQVPAVHRP